MKTFKKQEEEIEKQKNTLRAAFMILLFVFILAIMFFSLQYSKITNIAGMEIKENDLNNFMKAALENNQSSVFICELNKDRCVVITDLEERLK